MCGGASRVMIRDLNLVSDVERRLTDNGLNTAQAILDEGKSGLAVIGISDDDIQVVSESIHHETGEWLD